MSVIRKLSLDSGNWKSLAIHVGLVSAAAALTYVSEHVSGTDFGVWTPLVVATATTVLGYINKVIANPSVPPTPAPIPVPSPLPPGPAPFPTPNDGSVDFPIGS